MKPVCLVIGAGAGIGGTVGKRFAQENYHAVLCRRSNEEGLNTLVSKIHKDGCDASGFLLN
ncbi:MAG: SDR family NAD(P)-dependent oxidoreductase, partial [Porticoccaceae bacterium]|nr:SDR family NAD(P)-dependent oxidoreductase [Porticoccaceae bacterium]